MSDATIKEEKRSHRTERITGLGELQVWCTIDWPRAIQSCKGRVPIHRIEEFCRYDIELTYLKSLGGETTALRRGLDRPRADAYTQAFHDAAKLIAEARQ